MSRPCHPWYRRSHRRWFVTVNGRKVPLPVTDPNDEAAAVAAWQALTLTSHAVNPAQPVPAAQPATRTVAELVKQFLDSRRPPLIEARTHANYTQTLRRFATSFGHLDPAAIRSAQVERWAVEQRDPRNGRPWSNSTRSYYLVTVQIFLRWAGVPLELSRPPSESRGAESVLTDEQFDKVLAEAERLAGRGADLGQLLRVLRETGARPQEVARLTVEVVDWVNACVRWKKHKTARHGKERVIHFPAAAVAILERQRDRYGSGFLFRTIRGGAYAGPTIGRRLRDISERVGFRVIAYGLGRHSFATRALVSGVPDTVVAALLGHRSTQMVHRNYSHVAEQSRVLKEAVEKVSRKAG